MMEESFLSHLEALRRMLLENLGIFVLLLIPGWYFAPELIALLQRRAAGTTSLPLHYFALLEPFLVELKAGALLALGAGMPFYFWRIWRFLSPALYLGERRWIAGTGLAALVLFWCGAALAYFAVVPLLLRFAMGFARDGLTPVVGVENFVMLVLTVCTGFGVMFEFPLLVLLLIALGAVRLKTLKKRRAPVLVGILVLAAVLTPPDVVSQVMLAAPCYLLFEATLLVGGLLPRRKEEAARHSYRVWESPPEEWADEAEAPESPGRKKRRRTRPAPRRRKR